MEKWKIWLIAASKYEYYASYTLHVCYHNENLQLAFLCIETIAACHLDDRNYVASEHAGVLSFCWNVTPCRFDSNRELRSLVVQTPDTLPTPSPSFSGFSTVVACEPTSRITLLVPNLKGLCGDVLSSSKKEGIPWNSVSFATSLPTNPECKFISVAEK